MKNILKISLIIYIFTTAVFAKNTENPLYLPKNAEIYSKTGFGVMYEKTDHAITQKKSNTDGTEEAPIWRLSEDIGIGITNRFSISGLFVYTNDEDIQRSGFTNSQIGGAYRIFDGINSDFVWETYATFSLGGAGDRKTTVVPVSNGTELGFKHANYSDGRWAVFAGMRFGKTWDKFTASVFGEFRKFFSNDNTNINISNDGKNIINSMVTTATGSSALGTAYINGLPEKFSATIQEANEYFAGINVFYEISTFWSVGGGFSVRHRAAHIIDDIALNNYADLGTLSGGAVTTNGITNSITGQFLGTMDDGIDEYMLSAVIAHKLTISTQLSLYSEYTLDDADSGSTNGTDVKFESRIRINTTF